MINGIDTYMLVDPIGKKDSGITTYNQYAESLLLKQGMRVLVKTIGRKESIVRFRKRIAIAASVYTDNGRKLIIESPETEAATLNVSSERTELHIRLHCSKNLGSIVQGQMVSVESLALEQKELSRANMISAPSSSAFKISRELFQLPERIAVYPNPAPDIDNYFVSTSNQTSIATRPYVLFVGRWHRLKGNHFLIEFAQKLPEIDFKAVTISKNLSKTKLPPNLDILDGDSWNKKELYERAALVVIPSIFETASMVGIEAMSYGTPVLTWAHLGISEYGEEPNITKIYPFEIDNFVDNISSSIKSPAVGVPPINFSEKMNELFFAGIQSASSREALCKMPSALLDETQLQMKFFSDQLAGETHQINGELRQKRRKLRKLVSKPSQFFLDTKLLRKYRKKKYLPHRNSISKISSQTFSLETLRDDIDHFTKINRNGKIEFGEAPKKPAGLITAFLYPIGKEDSVVTILNNMDKFDDFRYLQSPFLQIGAFESFAGLRTGEIVDRIDTANKKRISEFDHIILIDPDPSLVSALRCCGSRQRMIVVISEKESLLPEPYYTDVLICLNLAERDAPPNEFRRLILVNDAQDLCYIIRRAVQEAQLVKSDVLLPIINFDNHRRDELLDFDARYFQGIIELSNGCIDGAKNISEQYKLIEKSIKGLAVTSSIYLKYRTICDAIDQPGNLELFLTYSLYDGVLFDVRT